MHVLGLVWLLFDFIDGVGEEVRVVVCGGGAVFFITAQPEFLLA